VSAVASAAAGCRRRAAAAAGCRRRAAVVVRGCNRSRRLPSPHCRRRLGLGPQAPGAAAASPRAVTAATGCCRRVFHVWSRSALEAGAFTSTSMENYNVKEDEGTIKQTIAVLKEQRQKASDVQDELNALDRELTEHEQRREGTATFRYEAYSSEITLLNELRAALVASGKGLVRDSDDSVERDIQSLKDALKVEEDSRDELDLIPTLSAQQQRRGRSTAAKCAAQVEEILSLRKVQIAKQVNLAPVVPTEGGGAAAGTTCTYAELIAKVLPSSPIRVASPTRPGGGGALLRSALATFSLEGPVFLHPVLDGGSLDTMRSRNISHDDLLKESTFYELVGDTRPAWVTLLGKRTRLSDGMLADILFGASTSIPSFRPVAWPGNCIPELLTRSARRHAGFNAEVKSVSSAHVWNELVTYVTLSTVDALFRCSSDARYYANPPVGYGVVSFPHCGYIMAVEWIGKLFVTPYSQPFFIGSNEHKAAVAGLPDVDFNEFIDVHMENIEWHRLSNRSVCWTGASTVLMAENDKHVANQFVKLMTCESFDHLFEPAGFLRRLYKTYKMYGTVWDAEAVGEVPRALLRARLWCGVFAVAVTMDFIDGVEATEKQLQASTSNDEKGARAIATAVVWLARRGLIYYDLREPNILVDSDGCWRLIDYDDMVVVDPGSVNTVADMEKVLETEQQRQRLTGVVAAFKRFPKLVQLIDEAFQSQ